MNMDYKKKYKESEDERIRKVLLNDFRNNCSEYYCEGVNRDMIITWLANQGKETSWRPTDEQMTELEHLISGCPCDIEIVRELQEQLKSLNYGEVKL